jgi:NADP-dependent 3-hydroxy acid dehydrogenase YdfG
MAKSVKADDQPNQSIEVEKELERLKWNLGRVDLLVNTAGVFIGTFRKRRDSAS